MNLIDQFDEVKIINMRSREDRRAETEEEFARYKLPINTKNVSFFDAITPSESLDFPNIDPVALSLGPLEIRWYALAYLVGILLGWRYALSLVKRGDKHLRPTVDDIDNFIPFAVLGVVLGGRLGYVLFYQTTLYIEDPLLLIFMGMGILSLWRYRIP